jgi:hypothetical protein
VRTEKYQKKEEKNVLKNNELVPINDGEDGIFYFFGN